MLYVVIFIFLGCNHQTAQYSTVQYSTGGGDMLYVVITKLGTVQYSTAQYSTVQAAEICCTL